MTTKTEKVTLLTPVGRLINESLLEKDKFNEEAKAAYKIEMAFEPGDLEEIEEALGRAAEEKWGAGAYDLYFDDGIVDPILDGDKLAARREEKGKPGDAYKGKAVIRAHTIYNKDGQDAPGGIAVYGPEYPAEIGPANRQELYIGCYGQMALTIGTYDDRSGNHALMFYLCAFQKTGDGERLVTARDYSEVFKPVGRKEGEGKTRRKVRS